MKVVYPYRLKPGARICLIDPANAFTEETVKAAEAYLSSQGYSVGVSEDMAFKRGTPKERAQRFNRVISNPENRAVICVWGGYGAMTLLEYLDYDALRENRPVFVGYSDITALHAAIEKQTGLVTFHGPSFYSPVRPTTQEAKDFLIQMLMEDWEEPGERPICNLNNEKTEMLKDGECEGILTGGNLTLISRLMGTPFEIDTRDKILFFEEISERPYRLHGMLTQLKMAGKLEEAAGIVVGSLNNCEEPGRPGSGLEAVKDVLKDIGIPVMYGLRAGHVSDSLTLPLHVPCRIKNGKLFAGVK